MNQITQDGIDLVKQFESFMANPYRDPIGVLTVGFGHVVIPGEQFQDLTEEQASDLLLKDLARFGTYVTNHITVPLNDNQFSALSSLVFNVGTGPLLGHLGTYLNQYLYEQAAEEFPRWVYAEGKVLPGLVARRAAEQALFNKPSDSTASSC
jgi:lysozyme